MTTVNKDLKGKAVDIKGKQYVLVSDRVIFFNEIYKDGCITSQIISPVESQVVVVKAVVYPEGLNGRYFTGHAQEVVGEGYINKTAALENCETSAVGRALGFMGIGVIESIASADEINKATRPQPARYSNPTPSPVVPGSACVKCGAPMKVSKAGNPYCSAICFKKNPQQPSMQVDGYSQDEFPPPPFEG